MKKKNFIIATMMIIGVITIVSCTKSDNPINENVVGTYYGSFTTSSSLKSALLDDTGTGDGVAEVTMMVDNQIQVHCLGEDIDTIFILDYYAHNDSVMVCLTGDDFEGMYGHMLGEGHMGGSMMGDIGDDETEWMHHLNDEHDSGDLHFGGFDMNMGTFTYSFRMMDDSSPYYLTFKGSK